ncbi:hypothetical protein BDD12DRAFT_836239 [Trichophaea hybrida]|nr:hypothetical protein BDD12DRAFT_836239 [Trichophaea hybrida]
MNPYLSLQVLPLQQAIFNILLFQYCSTLHQIPIHICLIDLLQCLCVYSSQKVSN